MPAPSIRSARFTAAGSSSWRWRTSRTGRHRRHLRGRPPQHCGERAISVDTIPLVGEQPLADAVRAVARLPRACALVLAGALMGGEIGARRARGSGTRAARCEPQHAGSVPDACDLVVSDPVQAVCMTVMAVADTAKFTVARLSAACSSDYDWSSSASSDWSLAPALLAHHPQPRGQPRQVAQARGSGPIETRRSRRHRAPLRRGPARLGLGRCRRGPIIPRSTTRSYAPGRRPLANLRTNWGSSIRIASL